MPPFGQYEGRPHDLADRVARFDTPLVSQGLHQCQSPAGFVVGRRVPHVRLLVARVGHLKAQHGAGQFEPDGDLPAGGRLGVHGVGGQLGQQQDCRVGGFSGIKAPYGELVTESLAGAGHAAAVSGEPVRRTLCGSGRRCSCWQGSRSKAVLGQLNDTAAALEDRQSPEVEQRLYRVMAQLSGTAATMAWDSGHQRRAQDYYRLALRAAHAGEDISFGANVLAGMARQMLYTDCPTDALELIRLAQDGSRGLSGPRVRAMLRTREAWAYAAMGRVAAFRRATGQAEEELASAGPQEEEPHWIGYFDQAELTGVTGGRLLDLARADPRSHSEAAAEHIRTALDARGTEAGRSHALDRIGLAETRFLAGDLTGAVAETRRAVEAASLTQSSRVRTQLGALYQYTVGRSESRAVREARDSIREQLAN